MSGCEARIAGAEEALAAPPFRRLEGDRLRVRADLVSALEVERVGASELAASLRGVGAVRFAPGASYGVRSALSAYVEQVFVNVGATVTRGQPLARLRSPEVARLRAEARRITIEQSSARDEIARLDRLVASGAASERERVSARARLQSLEAERAGVDGSLAAADAREGSGDVLTLRAAGAGVVIARSVDPGERVDPGANEPAFLIGDPSALVVTADFAERDAPLLRVGAACSVRVASVSQTPIAGHLRAVVGAVDRVTHTARAVCELDAPDRRLQSEMAAEVVVAVRGGAAVLVPRSALLLRRDDRVMFVRVAPDVLERRVVEVGAMLDDRVQVVAGVAAGEMVVTEGAVLLDGELDRVL